MNAVCFRCSTCEREIDLKGVQYTCPYCSGNLDVLYDYNLLRGKVSRKTFENNSDNTIWRYSAFYPVENERILIPLQVGWTPLIKADRLASILGVKKVWVKDDTRNPSASFKDRASAVFLAKGLEMGMTKVCGASTGNAASSTACLCASVGLSPVIFVPETAPQAKIAQLLIFGAKILAVKGSYDDAFDLCVETSTRYGWYNRNTGYNPYTREGKKSCSFEICEQLAWNVPDFVFVPVGDGNIISGIWKGFSDFYNTGLIDSLPRLVAVQSEKSSAVADAVLGDGIIRKVNASTIADSISVDMPRDGIMAVKAVKQSKGTAVKVSDEEILDAIKIVARYCGVFAEPAGATSVAGLIKMAKEGKLGQDISAVCLITGSGLKDVSAAMKIAGSYSSIDPSINAVESELKKHGIL